MDVPIGELSARTSVKVPTIRYYEQIGLRAAPPRSEGGIASTARAKSGMPANWDWRSDIRELLAMTEQPQASCHQADSIAQTQLLEVERRIASLQALRGELSRMVEECGHGRVCDCCIIEALADHSLCHIEHTH